MAAIDDGQKLKWRHKFRRKRRSAVELGLQADVQIERLLLRRFERLLSVKRFVLLWVALFVMLMVAMVFQTRALSSYYQQLKPAAGGIFSEGLVGSFTNTNPLYAASAVDNAISHLVFSGLLKYDSNNQLTGDLAQSWSEGPAPTHYTVNLRHNVKWHDGVDFTADDVVFTYKTIADIRAQSPLYNNWKDVSVTKIDQYTVGFDLPSPLSSFPHSMINGIVPQHLLKKIALEELRSAPFNTEPVGTGPFRWKYHETLDADNGQRQHRISLATFNNYFGGPTKLDGFNLISFPDEKTALDAFKQKQINALAGLESVPAELSKDGSVQVHTTPFTTAVMAFFNTSHPLLNDLTLRRALVRAVERQPLVDLTGTTVKLVDSPLLRGQLGYDAAIVQPPYNQAQANQLLEDGGWKRNAEGYRTKNGQLLQFTLRSQDTRQYTLTSQYLQLKWGQIGVKANVQYHDGDDLQGQIIASHDYDVLVYGINIGIDPDVFAYWDSSQASISSQGHSNLSEYKSSVTDQALEGARTRSDPGLRAVKLKPFLTAWVSDAPALALYQPNFLYITRGPVFGYERKSINTAADRFYNVSNWMVRQSRQTN